MTEPEGNDKEQAQPAPVQAEATAVEAGQAAQPPAPEKSGGVSKRWYVVHTYTGYENKAKQALEERIRREGLQEMFGQVLIPTEEVVQIRQGKRRISKRKFFPGYLLVEMAMNEATWALVKATPKITGFVGDSIHPPPIPEDQVAHLTRQISQGTERVVTRMIFEKGDTVRVMDGPFANFNGVVDDVDQEKGKLRVLVSIFGRATPVEMDFMQVEKTQ